MGFTSCFHPSTHGIIAGCSDSIFTMASCVCLLGMVNAGDNNCESAFIWCTVVGMPNNFTLAPVMFSLRQLTPIWMLGLSLAYHYRDKPFSAGMSIAFASLTKFFPAIVLLPNIFRRKWSAVNGFALVWVIALFLFEILCPSAIPRYIEVNLIDAPVVIARIDNTAFLPTLQRLIGWPGLLVGVIFLGFIVWKG